MRLTAKLCLVLVLLLLASPVILLKGCGNVPPNGSTLTSSPASIALASISGPTCENVMLTLKDAAAGNPLNGLPVMISGGFAAPRYPSRYRFYEGSNCGPPSAARDSGFSGTTNDSGVYQFSVDVVAITYQPDAPSCAGGSTYTYQLAALDYNGEASPASDNSTTCFDGAISWTAEPRATAYAIIGRSLSDMKLLAVVPGTATTIYIDAGATTVLVPPTAVGMVTFTGTPATTSYRYAIAVLEDQTALTGAHIASNRGTASAVIATGSASLSTTNYFTIDWADVGSASYYAVYRRIDGGSWTLLSVVSASVYIDTGTAANSSASSFTDSILATSGTASITIGIALE